jgi:hypothetical protein
MRATIVCAVNDKARLNRLSHSFTSAKAMV